MDLFVPFVYESSLLLQSKILHYMRQMAVITPYAQFLFKFLSESPEYLFSLPFTSLLKPHISLIDIVLI